MRKIRSGKIFRGESRFRGAEPPEKPLSQFGSWLAAQGLAARTVECYLFDAGHFVRWLETQGLRDLRRINPALVSEYQAVLAARPGRNGRPLTAATRAHVIAALMALGKYLEKSGRVKANPMKGLSLPCAPRRLPHNLLPVRDMERLLAAPRLDDPVEIRNRALMELLYATGLRQSEALDLKLGDVDLSSGEVRVERGKGGYGRVVPLGREAGAVLAAYLSEARPKLARGGDAGFFFLSRRGRRVDPSRMLKTLKRYARRAGISRPVGFHTFRHSVATHLLQRGAGIRHIQEFLGHHSLASTQIYTHVSIGDLKAAHAKYHPREKMDL